MGREGQPAGESAGSQANRPRLVHPTPSTLEGACCTLLPKPWSPVPGKAGRQGGGVTWHHHPKVAHGTGPGRQAGGVNVNA